MVITWLGLSCFKIQAKSGDREITLITDPFDEKEAGLKLSRNLAADVVTVSHKHPLHGNSGEVSPVGEKKKPFIIESPGEYEIGGMFIYGVNTVHDEKEGKERGKNIIYRIEAEGLSILHLGDLGRELNEKEMENLGDVDVLLVPVGGGTALSVKKAAEAVGTLEPRIVIPMHYKLPELKVSLEPVDKFLRELGVGKVEPVEKLKVSRKDLPADEMKVVVLEKVKS